MSLSYSAVDKFYDYLEFYPEEGEAGYDGVHDGGWKGLRKDAPEEAKKQYEEYLQLQERAKRSGILL
ncbi:MAG: hypothetical protein IKW90_09240 [Lachnospiraceae bacterium]|nr:hypothetical protein [Lachnospiraceae bacterium]